jgi:hypothetical protein
MLIAAQALFLVGLGAALIWLTYLAWVSSHD